MTGLWCPRVKGYCLYVDDMKDEINRLKEENKLRWKDIHKQEKQNEILRKVNKMRWEEMNKMKKEIEDLKEAKTRKIIIPKSFITDIIEELI